MLLSKHHGLGNDFLVALDERNGRALGDDLDGDVARRLCDRLRGIGADGLIHGAAPSPSQATVGVDVVMHLFNSDGSAAEMSGNGIRCLGQAVAMARRVAAMPVNVLTDAGERRLEVTPGESPAEMAVRVEMGLVTPGPAVPTSLDEFLGLRHATVDVGNPHLVILLDDLDAVDLHTDGAWLEAQFEQGVNVEYMRVEGRSAVTMRVWERGAGITEACGTGACAAAAVAREWGLVDDTVRVQMPGGAATIVLHDDGTVTLIGPAVFVADFDLPEMHEALSERSRQ